MSHPLGDLQLVPELKTRLPDSIAPSLITNQTLAITLLRVFGMLPYWGSWTRKYVSPNQRPSNRPETKDANSRLNLHPISSRIKSSKQPTVARKSNGKNIFVNGLCWIELHPQDVLFRSCGVSASSDRHSLMIICVQDPKSVLTFSLVPIVEKLRSFPNFLAVG